MAGVVIGILIFAYAAFVVVKKIKAIKEGRYCSCGCSDCPSKIKCHKEK